MARLKTVVLICFVIFLSSLIFFKLKKYEEIKQKIVLAHEVHKVLGFLVFDLRDARESTIRDVPADGQWHHRLAFDSLQNGQLEYLITAGHLFRINRGQRSLIADNICELRIRRQTQTPDILEVQIKAQKNVILLSNLKIRMR